MSTAVTYGSDCQVYVLVVEYSIIILLLPGASSN